MCPGLCEDLRTIDPKELRARLKADALTMWPVNRQKIGNVRNKDREVATPEAPG